MGDVGKMEQRQIGRLDGSDEDGVRIGHDFRDLHSAANSSMVGLGPSGDNNVRLWVAPRTVRDLSELDAGSIPERSTTIGRLPGDRAQLEV
jgi:hypothetical protein